MKLFRVVILKHLTILFILFVVLFGKLTVVSGQTLIQPELKITLKPVSGVAPLQVEMHSELKNVDDKAAIYSWDLGDGTVSQDQTLRHTYEVPGVYSIVVHVTNAQDLTIFAEATVDVKEPNSTSTQLDIMPSITNFGFGNAGLASEQRTHLEEIALVLHVD